MLLLPTIADQVDDIAARAPAYTQSILTWEHGWARYYQRLRIPGRTAPDHRSIGGGDQCSGAGIREAISAGLVAGALSHIPFLLLIPILGFFLLKDGASLRRMLVRALPPAWPLAKSQTGRGAEFHACRLHACAAPGLCVRGDTERHWLRRHRDPVFGAARRAGRRPRIHPARRARSRWRSLPRWSGRSTPRFWRCGPSGSSPCSGSSRTT